MKTCTECGGQIEDSSLHDFHYVISTCVKVLQARVEKSEAAAMEFATYMFNKGTSYESYGGEDWRVWRRDYHDSLFTKKAIDYLVSIGLLEEHPAKYPLYRWTAKAPGGTE